MKKRTLAAAVLAALLLCACGGTDTAVTEAARTESSGTDAAETAQTGTEPASSAEEEEAASAQGTGSSEELFGMPEPFSGGTAEQFDSGYAIQKGEERYSLEWLYYSDADDYRAAGLTAGELEDAAAHFDELGLSYEAGNAVYIKIYRYITESINITENSSEEEILGAGELAAKFYRAAEGCYFFYNSDYPWKIDYEDPGDEIIKGGFPMPSYRCYGLYTDRANDVYIPMDYAGAKVYLTDTFRLTENGFRELCDNSPCGYYERDGKFYMQPYDGGSAGYDYSVIDSYDHDTDGGTVTYNCRLIGLAEEWGYDEDIEEPFTFRLKLEDGVWKFDGCSDGRPLVYF